MTSLLPKIATNPAEVFSFRSKRCQYVEYFSCSMLVFFNVKTTIRSCTKFVEMYLEHYRKII